MTEWLGFIQKLLKFEPKIVYFFCLSGKKMDTNLHIRIHKVSSWNNYETIFKYASIYMYEYAGWAIYLIIILGYNTTTLQ